MFVPATDVESDEHAVCNNSGMCVCLFENEWGLIEGPLWAVKIALLQSLYLSCANIAEVMSLNTIHLHTYVWMREKHAHTNAAWTQGLPPTQYLWYGPNSFTVILFSKQEETVDVNYGWDTKESPLLGTVGLLQPRGPEKLKPHQL